MIRSAAFAIAATIAAIPAPAHAACNPQADPNLTMGGTVFGRVSSQWNSYFGAKVDRVGGCSDTQTINAPLITGGAIANAAITGGSISNVALSGVTFSPVPPLRLSSNATTAPAIRTGTIVQITGADAISPIYEADSFGASAVFAGQRADGTNAAPTGLVSGDVMTALSGFGYDGTAYSANAGSVVRLRAAGTWSGTSHPSDVALLTTPSGSTNPTNGFVVGPAGGLYATGATGGDAGVNSVNANVYYVNGVAAVGAFENQNTFYAGSANGGITIPAWRKITATDQPTSQYGGIVNCGIEVTESSNNVSFTLTDVAGNPLSATNPCVVTVGVPTANPEALPISWSITANQTVTLNSGSTLGTSNGVPFRVWIQIGTDGIVSQPQLIVSVQSNPANPAAGVAALGVAGTTACVSCATATALQTYYGNTAMAVGSYYRTIGFAQWGSGLATAGVWNALPSLVGMMTPGIPLPGKPTGNVAIATSTANVTIGTTTPTSTGLQVQIGSAANPISTTNFVRVRAYGSCTVFSAASGDYCAAQISRGVVANLVGSTGGPVSTGAAANVVGPLIMETLDGPQQILQIYRVFFWGSAAVVNGYQWNQNGLTTEIVAEEIEG